MLSNTAAPKYYQEFRARVLAGEIPVCLEISQEMDRIDKLIQDPDVYYDDQAIDGFIAFCEGEMTLTDGGDVALLDSFKLWAEQLLSWFIYVERLVWDKDRREFVPTVIKKRLRDTQYLVVARGSAKSMYAAFLQAYFLVVDLATTHQVTVAPTMKQAEEVLSPIRTAITRAKGPVFQLLTEGSMQNTTGSRATRQKLAPTKKGIENLLTNSLLEIRPMAIDKVQGLRSKYNTVDEWLSGDTRENVITALHQGATKFEDPIIVAISSEGTVRNGVGDTIKMELNKILKNESIQPNVSIFIYKLDDVAEVAVPAMWPKANPNLGYTVSFETYEKDVRRAEDFPDVRNEILAKRFGLPMEGYTFFFTYEEIQIPLARLDPMRFVGMPASLGIDLSRGDDFCAFTFMFPLGNERFGVKTRSYITSRTYDMLQAAQKRKYQSFIEEGTLIVFEGVILNPMDVYDDLYSHIELMEYDVRCVGYDPYNAVSFMRRWIEDEGEHGVHKVIQGARTESVPLGELKKLAQDKRLLFDEEIMKYTMGHAVAWVDSNGNRKLVKLRAEEKIDNVSALLDAHVAYSKDPEQFD